MSKSKIGINPVELTYRSPSADSTSHAQSQSQSLPHPKPVSKSTHHVAGVLVTIFGLEELDPNVADVAVLWLLHPRLETQASMAPFASHIITEWNQSPKSKSKKGLIAVSFDQRNHGSRLVSAISNEAWRSGNEHHGIDMFSCFAGTAQDTSLLLDFLPGYIFPDPSDRRRIVQNLVLGISLGGYAAWHVIMHDPRFSAAVVTIGCPDYIRIMTDRARLSKRKTWTSTSPPGKDFLGSKDFPPSLIEKIKQVDPAAYLWGLPGLNWHRGQEHLHTQLSEEERAILLPVMTRCFANKRILNLAGGADKLVNYAQCKPFLSWLKASNAPGGWFDGSGLLLEDIIFDGVGHEVPSGMVVEMIRFVKESLEDERANIVDASSGSGHGRRGSKI
jgi:pimeloyl-ACP methyl ester carboxylesterase